MRRKRLVLLAGLLMVLVSAPQRVRARGPTDIELTGYGGSTVDSWACGPSARVRYGGVGGEVHIRPGQIGAESKSKQPDLEGGTVSVTAEKDRSRADDGMYVGAGGALETRTYEIRRCDIGCKETVPPNGWLIAGGSNFGYDWRHFGLRGGGSYRQHYPSSKSSSPGGQLLPDLRLRFGPSGANGILGFGSYTPTTLLRPGLYAGGSYTDAIGWGLQALGGIHASNANEWVFRFDVSGFFPVRDYFRLGLGAASLSTRDKAMGGGEGRLLLGFSL